MEIYCAAQDGLEIMAILLLQPPREEIADMCHHVQCFLLFLLLNIFFHTIYPDYAPPQLLQFLHTFSVIWIYSPPVSL